jgi:UDP-glucose 4-epimerase
MKKKIIITGGAGFIGSHLCEYLIAKKEICKVVLIDNFEDGSLNNLKSIIKNKKLLIKKIDIRDKVKLSKVFDKNIDTIFHLAAQSDIVPSIENPVNYIETNFNGTLNILNLMNKYKIKKIIYAASSSCYGIPKNYPTEEKEKIDTKYPYAYSKYIAETLIINWAKIYKIKYISLRLFNVYGTRSRTNNAYGAVIGIFLKQKIMNKNLTIVGNGRQRRDFINVKDVVFAFYKSFRCKNWNKIYNVGSGKSQEINYLADLIGGNKTYVSKRPGEPDQTLANIKKIKKDLDWRPSIKFEDGIQEILKNKHYWKNAILWDKKKIARATKIWFDLLS